LRAQSDTARSVAEAAEWQTGLVGIFGEICGRDRRLQDGDRVELYRSLIVDPKAARRARATAIR
jgi:putative ubiquitin-RnfH superfamily antitoxin RatB of RatAB toxin-antitoxin module